MWTSVLTKKRGGRNHCESVRFVCALATEACLKKTKNKPKQLSSRVLNVAPGSSIRIAASVRPGTDVALTFEISPASEGFRAAAGSFKV